MSHICLSYNKPDNSKTQRTKISINTAISKMDRKETFIKLLKQGYRYHKIRKSFSKFYHRHSELIIKYNIGLKTLPQQGISEPIFYGDLV